MARKAFVSGCFDLLHSGHVAFFKAAAAYGDLYVALGSDKTVYELKGRLPVNTEDERLFMVQSLGCVKEAFISHGSGILDFEDELRALRPGVFVVNEDGNVPAKRQLCEELGIEYVVLKREPHANLPRRSTTALRQVDRLPYRIDLAGGWLDQPFVSRHHPGAVITISIEPTIEFNDRSGMATSTRRAALELWGNRLPAGDPAHLARVLFCCDNPPGTPHISGSQDAIGIVYPGLNKAYYMGEYWPGQIESVHDEETLRFVERALYLLPLGPRGPEFDVLSDTHISPAGAQALAEATGHCWEALLSRDLAGLGSSVRASFEAQVAMFPHMLNHTVAAAIAECRDRALGWKLSGAGGGGYLILVASKPVEGAFQIVIRRAPSW
ncbi:MAG: adenylyltransferase/cytidyltransferase family protein [Chloroflexi bacterium]|nr:adenylyltransferase/cytidyltransferase family protein [Chloroflexota bacterium]